MAGDIELARTKMLWADRHLILLENEIDAYKRRRPCVATVEPHPTGWLVRRTMREPPPSDLSLRLADVLSNLGASLDYLAWQLVLRSGGTPTKGTYFPIRWDSPQGKGPHTIAGGVSNAAAALIEALQPYHDVDPLEHPLAILRQLNRINKHRYLTVVTVVPHASTLRVIDSKTGRRLQSSFHAWGWDQECVLVPWRHGDLPEPLDVEVVGQLGTDIAIEENIGFKQGEPAYVLDTLKQLRDSVSNVFHALAPIFERSP